MTATLICGDELSYMSGAKNVQLFLRCRAASLQISYEYILEGELPDSGPFFRDSLLIALLDYKILSIVVE